MKKNIEKLKDAGELLVLVDKITRDNYDGHYNIFSFTTNYRGCYRTPYNYDFLENLENLKSYNSLYDLLFNMVKNPENFEIY